MGSLQAYTKELLADAYTPVSAYVKLCQGEGTSFLFESGEGVDSVGRYSIVAWEPISSLRLEHGQTLVEHDGREQQRPENEFFDAAQEVGESLTVQELPPLPFVGSLMGYVGYEAVRLMERLPPGPVHHLPVAWLCFPACFVVFDHLHRRLTLVALAQGEEGGRAKLAEMVDRLHRPVRLVSPPGTFEVVPPPREPFLAAVERAKEYIMAGDIFQVVPSARFTGSTDIDPLAVYRWLRVKSPSPYMFFLRFPGFSLAGSSPETLVKVKDGMVYLRPIAGTKGRSADPEEDLALEREMMDSAKERAEHIMLVDLARNDAGRVSRYGTVQVSPYMTVERYSHVMHIVSQVNGQVAPEVSVWDAFKACFPAGTLSGAPKVRAMEIINELEGVARGPYGGAVGCFGPGQYMDTCIAIRMIQFDQGRFTLQAGAGIVADSDPQMEYEEICHKAAQGLAALKLASEGLA
ncbi:MAG: anthranilate synthase component I family protein [Proteobacteria bacterium]|nr:anthranilate synthase component I family protein [Pseudomonadota bacterium]MBU1449670.1 anthranilate synthase component I family protein [Pseudomonadota bacterium]MBU2516913.1 anthranilate synthase component I family protein [Pseudomonadota bacterium]